MVAVAGLVGSLVFLRQDQVTSSVCAGLGAPCRDHMLQPGQDILLTAASTGLNAGQAKGPHYGHRADEEQEQDLGAGIGPNASGFKAKRLGTGSGRGCAV